MKGRTVVLLVLLLLVAVVGAGAGTLKVEKTCTVERAAGPGSIYENNPGPVASTTCDWRITRR